MSDTVPTTTDNAAEPSSYDHDDLRVARDAAREALRHLQDVIDILNRALDGEATP